MLPLSEDAILATLGDYFPLQHPSLLMGRGDDCCVLRASNPLCVSADLFLEDVHFRRSYFSARDVGHKALAVNVSDVAACGARPVAFTLCLALPDTVDMAWLHDFFAGMGDLSKQQRMVLCGGDLSRGDKLHISITVWGESGNVLSAGGAGGNGLQGSGAYLTRGGSMPGDSLFVIGELGLARTGLQLLESQGRSALEGWPAACAAHLCPSPQVAAGLTLARMAGTMRAPSLMDVSDGLARDLPRLLGLRPCGFVPPSAESPSFGAQSGPQSSGLGAEIVLPEGRLHPEVIAYARQQGLNPVEQAFLGGEDYALLGTCSPELLPSLHAALPQLLSIGTITDTGTILCNNGPAPEGAGFDHFQQK